MPVRGDEIQKFVDVPGGFLYDSGLGFRDGMCSYSTPGLRIFGCGIPTFRGCPDHQPGAYDQPPLSGTSEQLALCAVKHLEFDCSKRRGSITRTVGRSCCETACRSPTHRRERIPYRTSVCQRAGASKGSVSRRRGEHSTPSNRCVTGNKRGVWQAEAWRRRSERVGCGSRAHRSALFRVRRLGPPGARRPSWPAGTGAVVGRRFRRRVALRPLTRA
jgi:hypothetical protein